MKIGIIGAGAYGTALGGILEEKGYETVYYDPAITDKFVHDLVWDAEMVLLVAPSSAVPELLPQLDVYTPLIIATKGILKDDIFADFHEVMALSGPSFADDMKAKKETFLTVTDDRLVKLFDTDYISFDHTKDLRGVLMCGALKNVYAIRAGYLGLRPGTAEHQQFITDVAKEMELILLANGAMRDTVYHYCGVDDLKLTCNLPSRNYEFGMKKRENPDYQPEKTVEGLATLARIVAGEIEVPLEASILKEIINMNVIGE